MGLPYVNKNTIERVKSWTMFGSVQVPELYHDIHRKTCSHVCEAFKRFSHNFVNIMGQNCNTIYNMVDTIYLTLVLGIGRALTAFILTGLAIKISQILNILLMLSKTVKITVRSILYILVC